MLMGILYLIHAAICIFLILVVLLQRGKGADLSVFGGGSTQAAFGARSATTLLHKMTVGFFVAFIVSTLAIAWFQAQAHGTSVIADDEEETAQEAPATLGEPTPGEEPTGEAEPSEPPAQVPQTDVPEDGAGAAEENAAQDDSGAEPPAEEAGAAAEAEPEG